MISLCDNSASKLIFSSRLVVAWSRTTVIIVGSLLFQIISFSSFQVSLIVEGSF
jgi:hypothetical protein